MKRSAFLYLSLLFLLVSCVDNTGSIEFLAPDILSAEADADVVSVNFTCTLSAPRARECGFVVWSELIRKDISGTMSDATFSATAEGLFPSTTYQWYAYIKTGKREVRSETKSITTKDIILPPEPKDIIEIPDEAFKAYLTANFDTDGDAEISESEALRVKKIAVKTDEIFSLEGIEHFTNLDTLICRGVDLDVSEHEEVTSLGRLTTLDLSKNTFLIHLECDANHLKTLILPDNPWLKFLLCSHNYLTELDLTNLSGLEVLKAFNNKLTAIDVSCNPLLRSIEVHNNNISSIDVTCCPMVDCLNIGNNNIKEVDLSNCPRLYWLGVFDNDITSVDLKANNKLHYLNCYNSPISSLDLSSCPSLYSLRCWGCQILELDISMLPNLEIVEFAPMNSLKKIYVADTQRIEGVNVNRSDSVVPARTEIEYIYTGAPDGWIYINDPVFKEYMISRFDFNGDGELSNEEALKVTEIEVTTGNISSLKGIERCSNLERLDCEGSLIGTETDDYGNIHEIRQGKLTELDITSNPKLRILHCCNNLIESIDLSTNPDLEVLVISDNKLTSIDLSHNLKIRELWLQGNNYYLSVTDITHLPLEHLHLSSLEMTRHMGSDFLTYFPNLMSVNFSEYEGETIDLSKNTKLADVWCWNMTSIKVLDLSGAPNLKLLECGSGANGKPEKVIVHKDIDISSIHIDKCENTIVVNAE